MRQSSVYCQIENKFHGLESMEMIHKKTFHRNQHMTQGERWHPKSTVVPVDMLDIAGDRAKELLFDQLPYELLKEKPEVCVFEVVVPWQRNSEAEKDKIRRPSQQEFKKVPGRVQLERPR